MWPQCGIGPSQIAQASYIPYEHDFIGLHGAARFPAAWGG
jgi:hypothetical protein